MPRFSVIIATHHRPVLLARALASLHAQTLGSPQILVVSDARDPQTYGVANRALRHDDVFLQRHGEAGPAPSRNLALALASGDYVLFLDDDDTWRPDFLAELSRAMAGVDPNRIVYTNFEVVQESSDADPRQVRTIQQVDIGGQDPSQVYVKNFIPNNCQVFPQRLAARLRFDPDIAYEDWDFLLSGCDQAEMQHLPIFGPRIHKHDDGGTEHRGDQNQSRLVDCYLSVYRRHPPKSARIAEQRRQLFESIGIALVADAPDSAGSDARRPLGAIHAIVDQR